MFYKPREAVEILGLKSVREMWVLSDMILRWTGQSILFNGKNKYRRYKAPCVHRMMKMLDRMRASAQKVVGA